MFSQFTKTKTALLFSIAICLLLVVFVLLFLLRFGPNSQQSPLSAPLSIIAISPNPSSQLTPGSFQRFTFKFNRPLRAQDVDIMLTYTEIVSQRVPTDVKIEKTLLADKRTIQAATKDPIVPYSEYQLVVSDSSRNTPLYTYTYYSKVGTATSTQRSDLSLRRYLPYETETYRLSYNETLKMYVFNLRLDPNSSENFNLQYENAKTEATSFIENKGINLSDIMIDWRRK